jgi:hypothetical protein
MCCTSSIYATISEQHSKLYYIAQLTILIALPLPPVRAVGDLLFERPDPTPITPGPQGSKRRDGRVSRRELEHMLDLSAKNVVVAVRLYAPTAAAPLCPSSAPPSPTKLSAISPTTTDSSSPVPPPMVVTTVEKDVEKGESEGEKEIEVALPPPL